MKLLQFFRHNHFRKEITLVVILKLLALFAIWYLFFSQTFHPDAHTMFNHFISG